MHAVSSTERRGIPRRQLTGDVGAVLLIAVLMLVLLTLMGAAAVTTSSIEKYVAANERTYRQNLYRAEGAAMLGAQRVENEMSAPPLRDPAAALPVHGAWSRPDPFDPSNWDPEHVVPAMDPQCSFIVVHATVSAPGGSLDLEGTRLHQFDIYGRSDRNRGTVIVQIGWRKRF